MVASFPTPGSAPATLAGHWAYYPTPPQQMTTAFRVFLMIFPVKLYIIVALSVNACRHCQIPPFVAYATSSPGRGKSFLIGSASGVPGRSIGYEKVLLFRKL